LKRSGAKFSSNGGDCGINFEKEDDEIKGR